MPEKCKICQSEMLNLVEQAYFLDGMSFREIIRFFAQHGLLLNLYNLSNHYNRHVSDETIQEYVQWRLNRLKEKI